MTAVEFQALLDADPFEPFTVHQTGGWTTDVTRPELASVTPHGCAEVCQPDGARSILSLDHVTAIKFITPVAIR